MRKHPALQEKKAHPASAANSVIKVLMTQGRQKSPSALSQGAGEQSRNAQTRRLLTERTLLVLRGHKLGEPAGRSQPLRSLCNVIRDIGNSWRLVPDPLAGVRSYSPASLLSLGGPTANALRYSAKSFAAFTMESTATLVMSSWIMVIRSGMGGVLANALESRLVPLARANQMRRTSIMTHVNIDVRQTCHDLDSRACSAQTQGLSQAKCHPRVRWRYLIRWGRSAS